MQFRGFYTSTWYYGSPTTTTTTSVVHQVATLEDVHPCRSYEDFMPEQRMSEQGYCVPEVSEFSCLEHGCHPVLLGLWGLEAKQWHTLCRILMERS